MQNKFVYITTWINIKNSYYYKSGFWFLMQNLQPNGFTVAKRRELILDGYGSKKLISNVNVSISNIDI